jgi:hypothetical protein
MGIFGSILQKLGFGEDEAEQAAGQVNVKNEAEAAMEAAENEAVEIAEAAADEQASPAVSEVDVVSQLNALSEEHSEDLDWKASIVDLMKLLGLDSSYSHRKELARELNCPEEYMSDSAKMNVWLHKQVMVKLAENGGNIPQDLLA